MSDCVIDTNILADILAQFDPKGQNKKIKETTFISCELCREINKRIQFDGEEGLVVASSFAFIEIANKFDTISNSRFNRERLCSFLIQPPNWFLVEPLGIGTSQQYSYLPKKTSKNENIELADAFHAATALQRGPQTILGTTDHKLHDTPFSSIVLVK